ncbi:hypothetical protein VU08_01465 [Desulfobulbus sp. F5]|nr:hypothetical protein [Desulfobulbus sp. F5]
MKQVSYATGNEIQRHGLEVLCKGLGVVGLYDSCSSLTMDRGTMCKTGKIGRRDILLTCC